ncbi:sulfatase-like hydrolase/transferase [Streptococcus sanguinis]|uniref:LTA synthase family protein n=1 Tax=Streptococcus sanguinis TaxID=1305 RepID=UPI0022834A07|nr:sulfatase-like hydrolase/transferase [Streptococcus sanguinis]MCY7041300.1 sulfatase-like hydrolase/transferase [Streptococcus sanguinis]
MFGKKKRKIDYSSFYTKYKDYRFTVLKYLFSIIISFLTLKTTGNLLYVIVPLLELIIIFLVSNFFIKKHQIIGCFINNLFILFYNVEILVLFFGNSFVTLIMLNNLSSWEALKGRIFIFGLGIVLLLIFSFLPTKYVETQNKITYYLYKYNVVSLFLLSAALTLNLSLGGFFGFKYSPGKSVYDLAVAEYDYIQLIQKAERESTEKKKLFYKEEVGDFIKKPKNIPEKPNVILIFTEGMSQHIIDDERNITPNIKELQSKSLNFSNYYNHTFATYRGIIGQLYSGYQLDNSDQNHLISLQSILKKEGYHTSFINTEAHNEEFTSYLNHLGFDSVLDAQPSKGEESTFDKDAYKELNKLITNQPDGQPFFISMYTFGTHIGMNSFDRKYSDGNDRLLNRFYDLDIQFGKFIEKFNNSKYSENTILVFTTDHATYVDDEYRKSFPNQSRGMGNLDKVPFFIYYKGVDPQILDAQGQNSVNLTPTILDYLDISRENYFLGNSLFANKEYRTVFSSLFVSELTYANTSDAVVRYLSKHEEEKMETYIVDYYSSARW